MALETIRPSGKPGNRVGTPRHVAIIMDGNGRWARRQGMPRLFGHEVGTRRLRQVLSVLGRHGVSYVTIYAFSTENWDRPPDEVNGLLDLLERVIQEQAPELHRENVRILHLGELKHLSRRLAESVGQAVELTRQNTGLTICMGFNYGGRSEIVEAVRQIVAKGVRPEEVTEEMVRNHLFLPGVPDPDLIIRTAGEQRLSNFMLWQAAYSEMYYTDTFWPDFGEQEAEKALEWYRQRQRRFGKLACEE